MEVDLAREALRFQLAEVSHLGPFTKCGPEDASITPSFEAGELMFTYEALSPRGAVFLGELASVGFFGAEARELLSL